MARNTGTGYTRITPKRPPQPTTLTIEERSIKHPYFKLKVNKYYLVEKIAGKVLSRVRI